MSLDTNATGERAPRRKALLIGNSRYVDPAIKPLLAPKSDVERLEAVLADPAIGNFQVIPRFDLSASEFMEEVSTLFMNAADDDLLLLYFAGHGIRDMKGRLHLAVQKTKVDRLRATSVPADFIVQEMQSSASLKKVLILDCCHAGAIMENGTARDVGYDPKLIQEAFLPGDGTGTYILAASRSSQSAFEKFNPETNTAQSIYTSLIVDAVQSGDAQPENPFITVSAIHNYVRSRRKSQGVLTDPEFSVLKQGDDLVLCRNPNVRRPLDSKLARRLTDGTFEERYYAIHRLSEILRGGDIHQAELVRKAFSERLSESEPHERDFELRNKIEEALRGADPIAEDTLNAMASDKPGPTATSDERNTGVVTPEVSKPKVATLSSGRLARALDETSTATRMAEMVEKARGEFDRSLPPITSGEPAVPVRQEKSNTEGSIPEDSRPTPTVPRSLATPLTFRPDTAAKIPPRSEEVTFPDESVARTTSRADQLAMPQNSDQAARLRASGFRHVGWPGLRRFWWLAALAIAATVAIYYLYFEARSITIFPPGDIFSQPGGHYTGGTDDGEQYVRIESVDNAMFFVPKGVLQEFSGSRVVFNIVARSSLPSVSSKFVVVCDFGALGNCDGAHFESDPTKRENFEFEVTLRGEADSIGTITIKRDPSQLGAGLDIFSLTMASSRR